MSRRRMRAVTGLVALGLAMAVLLTYGCWHASYTVGFLPPTIPGATYVGTTTCIVCHPEQGKTFRTAYHAAFNLPEREGQEANAEGCETCHGPGSLHVQNFPDGSTIVVGDWKTCVRCHLDKKAQFSLLYHHPVPEGLMSCTDCHDPHDGRRPVFRVGAINEKCLGCHPEVRGPWVFPHQAVTEDGCTTCHNPHGSALSKMLLADTEQPLPALPLPGQLPAHRRLEPQQPLCARLCTSCHQGVHGSNFSDALRHP